VFRRKRFLVPYLVTALVLFGLVANAVAMTALYEWQGMRVHSWEPVPKMSPPTKVRVVRFW
jgi:hypothetical protein